MRKAILDHGNLQPIAVEDDGIGRN